MCYEITWLCIPPKHLHSLQEVLDWVPTYFPFTRLVSPTRGKDIKILKWTGRVIGRAMVLVFKVYALFFIYYILGVFTSSNLPGRQPSIIASVVFISYSGGGDFRRIKKLFLLIDSFWKEKGVRERYQAWLFDIHEIEQLDKVNMSSLTPFYFISYSPIIILCVACLVGRSPGWRRAQ